MGAARMIWRSLAATAAIAGLLLTACAGLPTDGPVTAGKGAGEVPSAPEWQFYPDGPAVGASPDEIVSGFVEAATSPLGDWEIARQFLSEDLAETWEPEASVTVDIPGDRDYRAGDGAPSGETSVQLSVTPEATVDPEGSYSLVPEGDITLAFDLEQRQDGEWRIVSAPDGIVLDRDNFEIVYSDHQLFYFDPSWRYLVPDVRWFPASSNEATRIAQALVDGSPSPWLADSVVSAFGGDVSLAARTVPVSTDRVAEVPLNTAALNLDDTTLSRMMTQLQLSMAGAEVQSVRMTVAGTDLDVQPARFQSVRPDSQAAVLGEDGFGFLAGMQVSRIEGLSEAVEGVKDDITAMELSADHRLVAARLGNGSVWQITADGERNETDKRPGLIDPTIDPFGYVWTVPSDSPGEVLAWDRDVVPQDVAGAWTEATSISAMRLSRDGTRLAAIITAGGEQQLVVAGVQRDNNGAPRGVGEALRIAPVEGAAVGLDWLDDSTVGIAMNTPTASGTTIIEQRIGGPATETEGPEGVTTLTFGNGDSAVRLLTSTGQLYTRRGSSWQQTGRDIEVLATQRGMPPAA